MSDQEIQELKAKHTLTKEYLRRSLLKLKKSTEFLDVEIVYADEFEEDVEKFIAEVKRKRLV